MINDALLKSDRDVRPINIFVYLNLGKTNANEISGFIQPNLTQKQSYLKFYRVSSLCEGVNTTEYNAFSQSFPNSCFLM